MTRYAAGVEYLGTGYSGWQALAGRRTLQAELERALARVADQPVFATAAGRTDAGVHALQQVVHFDSDARRSDYAWLLGTNANLPDGITTMARTFEGCTALTTVDLPDQLQSMSGTFTGCTQLTGVSIA